MNSRTFRPGYQGLCPVRSLVSEFESGYKKCQESEKFGVTERAKVSNNVISLISRSADFNIAEYVNRMIVAHREFSIKK